MAHSQKRFSEAVKKGRAPSPALGRYQGVGSARAPAQGVARPVPSQNMRTAIGAVQISIYKSQFDHVIQAGLSATGAKSLSEFETLLERVVDCQSGNAGPAQDEGTSV